MLYSSEETILFIFHHKYYSILYSIIYSNYSREVYQCLRELHQWVKRIKRPISDAEDVVETLITYVKKSVLLADSVNPKN